MARKHIKNIWSELHNRTDDGVYHITGSGAPSSTIGQFVCGKGSTYTDFTTGAIYVNVGTAASPSWSGGAGAYSEVSITSAQVKAIRATPIQLVAAPGAGRFLEFLSCILLLDYGGTNVFTEAANNLAVRLKDSAGVIVSQTIEMTGFIDQSADTITNGVVKIDDIVSKANGENQPLLLHNTSGAEIAGNAANNNVLRVKTAYRVHLTGF